jgi:hypothetical protein
MTTLTTGGRTLAIVAGAAFVYGGLKMILGDALLDFSQWTTSVQLTVIMVGGTIAAGHLCDTALAAKRRGAALGFALMFLSGTALIVFNSVGKQAENSMMTESQVDAAAERRVGIKSDLERARKMLGEAQADLAKEARNGGCGKTCQGIQATIGVYEAAVKGHVADLEKMGIPMVVHARETEMAKVMAMFGAEELKSKAALTLLAPFFYTLFFELGSVISLGFAFRREPVKVEAAKVQAITEKPEGQITDKELEELRRIYAKPRLSLSNDDLAKKLGVSKSESSKRASKAVAAGILTRVPHGREVRLQLASAGHTLN